MKLSEKIEFWCIFSFPILMNGSFFSYSLLELLKEPAPFWAKFACFAVLMLYFCATVAGMLFIYDIEKDEI